ncbi:hypothetical protein JNM05_09615 [bacterium]|nr:hypothetical protein [bacterium]
MKILSFVLLLVVDVNLPTQDHDIENAYNSGRWDENLLIIDGLIRGAGSPQNKKYLAELYVLKARQYWAKTSHQNFPKDSALLALKQAEALCEGLGLKAVESDILQLFGQLMYRDAFENGLFDRARAFFRRAFILRESLANPMLTSQSLFYIGLTFEQVDNPDSASYFYKIAYTLASEHGFKVEQSDAARHLGGLAQSRKHSDEARAFYQESLLLRQEARYFIGVPYAMITLADLIATESPLQADSLYRLAIQVAERNRVWRAQINALIALGELSRTECQTAVPLFTEAANLSRKIEYKSGEKRANSGLLHCDK